MRLRSAILCVLLLAAPAYAQADKPTEIVVPNAPGGKAVVVSRAQLRAAPGTKTARLPHPVRAKAESKDQVIVPKSWDWTTNKTGKRAVLPMMGNDRYGDCYPVACSKAFILMQWQVKESQLTFDTNAVVRRYLQLAGGDNGTDDGIIFPEMRKGWVGPNGPHKWQDQLIVPATDKTALDLTGYCFGTHLFTFDVYENFQQVSSGKLMTGNQGRNVGGHAILFSGKDADGYRVGETWAIQPGFRAADSWVAGVGPEFIAVFSLEWFDSAGYAPNGLHYTVLAPLWNSLGGHVSLISPFPAPVDPTPPPIVPPVTPPVNPPVTPPVTPPAGSYTLTYTYTSDGRLVGPPVVNAQVTPAPAPANVPTKEDIKGVVEAQVRMAFPGVAKIGDANLNQLIEDIAAAVWRWWTSRSAPPAGKVGAAKGNSDADAGTVGWVRFSPGFGPNLMSIGLWGDAGEPASPSWGIWVGASYRDGKHPTWNGKPVKTNRELIGLLCDAKTPVIYRRKADPTTYGVETEGAFTTAPASVLKP